MRSQIRGDCAVFLPNCSVNDDTVQISEVEEGTLSLRTQRHGAPRSQVPPAMSARGVPSTLWYFRGQVWLAHLRCTWTKCGLRKNTLTYIILEALPIIFTPYIKDNEASSSNVSFKLYSFSLLKLVFSPVSVIHNHPACLRITVICFTFTHVAFQFLYLINKCCQSCRELLLVPCFFFFFFFFLFLKKKSIFCVSININVFPVMTHT